MRVCRYLTYFTIFLISLFSTLFATSHVHEDVHKVMDQLFGYHIDQKQMTPLLLTRSMKIYISNFDENYCYLLDKEVALYVQPTERKSNQFLIEYHRATFDSFFEVNRVIVASIERARAWRQQWKANELLEKARSLKDQDLKIKNEVFAKKMEEVRDRHYELFVHLIALHMNKLDVAKYEGREERLVALAEKQMRLIENGFLGVGDRGESLDKGTQEGVIIGKILKAMAASLDAHTAYYTPEEAHMMRAQLAKGMCGIGVVLQEGIDGIMIAEFVKGGPAEQTGALQVGDTIIAVDQKDVRGDSFPRVLELMRGKEGSKLSLQVMRGSEVVDVQMTRAQITLDDKRVDVSYEPYGDGIIGKITLHSFYEGGDGITSELDIKKAITELKRQGPLLGLVLDLRENGGGFLTQAVKVSGLFMKSGVVVISKASDGEIKYYRSFSRNKFYDGPLVVLISRSSASAAEILAQNLQDYGVAVIVGDEQSYGKGTIQHQTITDEKAKAFFKVTIGRYYTVSGRSTQIEGVKSDIYVPTKWQFEEMGESFSEFPLVADKVPAAYRDQLDDVDPQLKKWFKNQYSSGMQGKSEKWAESISLLQKNSEGRLANNENFQAFLNSVKEGGEEDYGKCDLQMMESVNIVKDMIFLEHTSRS